VHNLQNPLHIGAAALHVHWRNFMAHQPLHVGGINWWHMYESIDNIYIFRSRSLQLNKRMVTSNARWLSVIKRCLQNVKYNMSFVLWRHRSTTEISSLSFAIKISWKDAILPGGKSIGIQGGAELFVDVEAVPAVELPRRVQGTAKFRGQKNGARSIYFVGRVWSGAKVFSSAILSIKVK
jgi:hypothetical protein